MIRQIKNALVKRYFEFRIDGNTPYTIRLRKDPYQILFMMSHMRSGSSLLTHILCSNPDVIGYGETHIKYYSENDLRKLFLKNYLKVSNYSSFQDFLYLRMEQKYLFDKLLHNNKFRCRDFLNLPQFRFIFLLRNPDQALSSILDLKPQWNETNVVNYYTSRLAELENYARAIPDPDRMFFLTYSELINQTDDVLEKLQLFLGTQEPFQENYKIFRTTGQKGVGDSKGNIKAGKIIRKPRELSTTITPELLDKANLAFHQCGDTLRGRCSGG